MTNVRRPALSWLAVVVPLSFACSGGAGDGGGSPTPDPNEPASVREARANFPRFLDLQKNVLSSTCSPNPNVCHNSSNYPNLETAGNTLAYVEAPCNVELPDRTQGWDACERRADIVKAGAFVTQIAYVETVGPKTWKLGLRDAPSSTASEQPRFEDAEGNVVFNPPEEWGVSIALVTGTAEAVVTLGADDEFVPPLVAPVMKSLIGGNPNGNEFWGAEEAGLEAGALIYPGSPERSYLWGRITATVPGSRMPLANAPLTNAAYVAIACWIEGLAGDESPSATDRIDYDDCAFAESPIDYAVTE